MPEPTTPPAPAVAPVTPPAAPAAKPLSALSDPLFASLAKDLGMLQENPAAVVAAAPAPAPVKEPAAPAAAPAPAATTPPEPSPQFSRFDRKKAMEEVARKAAEETVRLQQQQKPQLPPPATPAAEVKLEDLTPEQQREIEIAKFAEELEPAKYKGRSQQLLEFYKKVDAYVAENNEDADRTFDDKDDEFIAFIRTNKPKWAPGEADALNEKRIYKKAVAEARKDVQADLDTVRQTAQEAKATPQIDRTVSGFEAAIDASIKPSDDLEKSVYGEVKQQFSSIVRSYSRLAHGVEPYKESDPNHAYLARFVTHQADQFEKKGGADKVRDGKTFVTPVQFEEFRKANDPRYRTSWTFTQDDIVQLITEQAKYEVQETVKLEEKRAAARGFTRSKPVQVLQTATPVAAEVQPMGGSRVTATPAPGAATPAPAATQADESVSWMRSALGLDRLKA